MSLALKLARQGLGRTSPNPAVGAVVVKGGKVISRGFHKRAGSPHAEAEALKQLNKKELKGATLYVTLEPCCHHGRTPPCTEAVIASGVKSVVVGAQDPNPRVAGKGIRALKAAGITVTTGVLEEDCASINDWYAKYITTGLPYVTLKLASTLDGRIATASGGSRWITGPEARRYVHRMRLKTDAVMVGANTVVKDDPELTVRHVRGKNPLKVVVDSTLRTPMGAKVFLGTAKGGAKGGAEGDGGLVIFTSMGGNGGGGASKRKISRARAAGAEVVTLPPTVDGVSVRRVLKKLGEMEVATVLVEGGGRLSASLLKAGLVDAVKIFLSPKILGGDGVPSIGDLGIKRLADAFILKGFSAKRLGGDFLIEGVLNRQKRR
jgi:diaminohydroxyphosphoribosylaminopyrimidine deaminase/5-amino-6-(5-phosphoribosylamino)uracil reductase